MDYDRADFSRMPDDELMLSMDHYAGGLYLAAEGLHRLVEAGNVPNGDDIAGLTEIAAELRLRAREANRRQRERDEVEFRGRRQAA